MRSLDDWEEDYISNKGYDSFVKEKLGMDGDDVETLTKIRKAVSNYCTKAIDSSTAKLRLGANFMENDIDEEPYEDRNRNDLVLECVDKITSQRAVDTLQTIVNCLHDGIDNLDSEYTGNGWKEGTLKNDFVLNESQFNDMVNVGNDVDECEKKSEEYSCAGVLFPRSFIPWLEHISTDQIIRIVTKCEEDNSNDNQEERLKKEMDLIKNDVVVKLSNDIISYGNGVVRKKEVRDEVVKALLKYPELLVSVDDDEITIIRK